MIKLIIWDWYKTLSTKHLYSNLRTTHPGAYDLIQNYFRDNNQRLQDWAQGKISYQELHVEFAKLTGLSVAEFDANLKNLKRSFDIDPRILNWVEFFRDKGVKQVIATDNFDVWDEFFLPQYSNYLSSHFTGIYNTNSFRLLTYAEQQDFIKEIVAMQDEQTGDTLLVDDNKEIANAFEKIGGQTLVHDSLPDLERRLTLLSKELFPQG